MLGKDESSIEYVEDRKGHDFRYALDGSKLEKMGWKPKYNFDTALEQTVRWYVENQMVVATIKTLIIGASGMLGSDLCKVFPEAIKLTHKELDITNRDQVLEFIRKIKPDIVLNAAAYTDVDSCEENKEFAFQVNGYGPGHIAEACSIIEAKLVHFSTDYIFDGSKKVYGILTPKPNQCIWPFKTAW